MPTTLHFACNVIAKVTETHVVLKGAITTMGTHKATNFQRYLDNTGMEVSKDLLSVLAKDSMLSLIQMYVDSPHANIEMPYNHPVMDAILTCGLSQIPNYPCLVGREVFEARGHIFDN